MAVEETGGDDEEAAREFKRRLVAARFDLLRQAYKLAKGPDAEDLVQETIMRAIAARLNFDGTNLGGWLFTILRNTYFNNLRKRRFLVEDADDFLANSTVEHPNHVDRIDLCKVLDTMNRLPPLMKEAMVMVLIDGMTYIEVAKAQGCAEGTVKSRVFRGREMLLRLLNVESYEFDVVPNNSRILPTSVE